MLSAFPSRTYHDRWWQKIDLNTIIRHRQVWPCNSQRKNVADLPSCVQLDLFLPSVQCPIFSFPRFRAYWINESIVVSPGCKIFHCPFCEIAGDTAQPVRSVFIPPGPEVPQHFNPRYADRRRGRRIKTPVLYAAKIGIAEGKERKGGKHRLTMLHLSKLLR